MTAIPVKRKAKRRDIVFPICNTIILILLMAITLYSDLDAQLPSLVEEAKTEGRYRYMAQGV